VLLIVLKIDVDQANGTITLNVFHCESAFKEWKNNTASEKITKSDLKKMFH